MGRHESEHLRRFLAARAAGDVPAMRHWWEELVIDFYDRMDGFVSLAHRGRLDRDEHDTAVQLSMVRFSERMIDSFAGVSMGELVNASKTLARGICMDVQRASIRARGPGGQSLDAGWDADAEDRSMGTWEAGEAEHRFERDELDADIRDFRAWALPQIVESRRAVLELTFHGATLEEIAGEVQISHDNAYQRRSRGMRDLKKLKEKWDA